MTCMKDGIRSIRISVVLIRMVSVSSMLNICMNEILVVISVANEIDMMSAVAVMIWLVCVRLSVIVLFSCVCWVIYFV